MVDNKLLSFFDQFTVPFSGLSAHSAIEKVLVLTFKGTKPNSPWCPYCKLWLWRITRAACPADQCWSLDNSVCKGLKIESEVRTPSPSHILGINAVLCSSCQARPNEYTGTVSEIKLANEYSCPTHFPQLQWWHCKFDVKTLAASIFICVKIIMTIFR